jgi:hypothetical protein
MNFMKILFFFFVFSVCIHATGAMEENKDSSKYHFLMTGTDYTSNTSSLGRFSALSKQPSISGFVSFYSKNGLNMGISSMALGNSDTTASKYSYEYDLNIGYECGLGEYFTLSASYTRLFYSNNSFSLKSLHNHELTAGIGVNKGVFYARASGYYLLGEYNEWMNSAHVGFNIIFKKGIFKNNFLAISPEVNTIMGNQQYYNQFAYKTFWYLYGISERYPAMTIAEFYEHRESFPIRWSLINNNPRILKNFRTLDKDLVISDLFRASNKYNISSVNLTLPVSYNLGNFSLNLSYSVTIPMNTPEYIDNTAISYYSAGIYYSFAL